jgi:hypothetical protein
MRSINEAYRVLSNKHLRREYDKSLVDDTQFSAAPPPAPATSAPTGTGAAPAAASAASAKWRASGRHDLADSIVTGFSKQFQKEVEGASSVFKWSEIKLEGFDWASAAGTWMSRYIIAMRGFGKADLQNAKKFANYCNLAIESNTGGLKKTYFLFFFGFQKPADQQVPVLLRKFCANENGERTPAPACIVLMDVVRRKSLLCGPKPEDDKYRQLLASLGMAPNA